MRTAPKACTPAWNLKSPSYARVGEWIAEACDELGFNLIARSFKYCEVTSNNLADYGNHFVRTSEFVDDLEEYMDDADFANAGDEWDKETQDILDSEDVEDDYDNEL